jgi:hypothetical protein
LLRHSVLQLLEDAGFEVVGQATDAADLLPDNTDDGLRAALAIRSERPAVGVLVLRTAE